MHQQHTLNFVVTFGCPSRAMLDEDRGGGLVFRFGPRDWPSLQQRDSKRGDISRVVLHALQITSMTSNARVPLQVAVDGLPPGFAMIAPGDASDGGRRQWRGVCNGAVTIPPAAGTQRRRQGSRGPSSSPPPPPLPPPPPPLPATRLPAAGPPCPASSRHPPCRGEESLPQPFWLPRVIDCSPVVRGRRNQRQRQRPHQHQHAAAEHGRRSDLQYPCDAQLRRSCRAIEAHAAVYNARHRSCRAAGIVAQHPNHFSFHDFAVRLFIPSAAPSPQQGTEWSADMFATVSITFCINYSFIHMIDL